MYSVYIIWSSFNIYLQKIIFFWCYIYTILHPFLPTMFSLYLWHQPVSIHVSFPLDLNWPPQLRVEAAQVVQQHLGLEGHLDPHGLACGLHPRGHVDRVSEEAVPRHLGAHHPGRGGAAVDPDPKKYYAVPVNLELSHCLLSRCLSV